HYSGDRASLYSFPTRRSSDLLMLRARCSELSGGATSTPVNAVPAGTGVLLSVPFDARHFTKSTGCMEAFRSTHAPSRPAFHEARSEEHTSELQSPDQLVCRLL